MKIHTVFPQHEFSLMNGRTTLVLKTSKVQVIIHTSLKFIHEIQNIATHIHCKHEYIFIALSAKFLSDITYLSS